ncbi:MAG TPA: DUF2079 domain-containing protein [Acidimicrobiales bacterium]
MSVPHRVNLSWLTDRLSRLGLSRRGRQAAVDQLTLFGPEVAEAPPPKIVTDRRARLLLLATAIGYVALFLYWTFRQHRGLGTQAFDIGIFDQGVWLLSRFKDPFITINGRNLFGDHASFILLPFAAIYWVVPSVKVLLAAQTLALGIGALPTFLIAREKLRNELFAALLGIAYLLNPVVGWANLSEMFHPDAFEIPLVLFTFCFLLRRRWLGYWVCVCALLLVKEDVGFLIFGMGVYVALRHDRRVGVITCAVSAAYLFTVFFLLIPAFLGASTVYTGRIPFGGPTGFVKRTFTHPGDVISHLWTQKRGWYLWQLFAPFGFVAWLAPSMLLIATGPLVLNLITSFGYQFDIRYHYSTLILPVIVVATIFGVASAEPSDRRVLVGVVAMASVVCAYLWSPTPTGRVHPFIADPSYFSVASFHRAERLLPKDAVVSAYYGYVPQISHRDEIYMFPNPWKASNWGTFDREGQRLPQADRVEYIFVPSSLSAESQAVLDDIRGGFMPVYDREGVQLFKRRP